MISVFINKANGSDSTYKFDDSLSIKLNTANGNETSHSFFNDEHMGVFANMGFGIINEHLVSRYDSSVFVSNEDNTNEVYGYTESGEDEGTEKFVGYSRPIRAYKHKMDS